MIINSTKTIKKVNLLVSKLACIRLEKREKLS